MGGRTIKTMTNRRPRSATPVARSTLRTLECIESNSIEASPRPTGLIVISCLGPTTSALFGCHSPLFELAQPNFKVLEFNPHVHAPWAADPYVPVDGHMELRPDRPGWAWRSTKRCCRPRTMFIGSGSANPTERPTPEPSPHLAAVRECAAANIDPKNKPSGSFGPRARQLFTLLTILRPSTRHSPCL